MKTGGAADIGIVSKVQVMRSHSVCAEGGTGAVMRPEEGDSFELHAWDTVKGSDFLADQDTVDRFVRASPDEIRLLEHWGVPWSRREDGRIMQRPFGGHSFPRACMAADKTGFFEMQALYDTLLKYETSSATTSASPRPCSSTADVSPALRSTMLPRASSSFCAARLF